MHNLPKQRHPDRASASGGIFAPNSCYAVSILRRFLDVVKAQDTMFHFPQAENSACILAFPLPTKQALRGPQVVRHRQRSPRSPDSHLRFESDRYKNKSHSECIIHYGIYGCRVSCCGDVVIRTRWPDSICIFSRWEKIKVATSVCTGGSKCPPDTYI